MTPIFEGDELVARGVQIEAASVSDKGKSLSINVFCYNAQPNVVIDYATGKSHLAERGRVDVAPIEGAAGAGAASGGTAAGSAQNSAGSSAAETQQSTETGSEAAGSGSSGQENAAEGSGQAGSGSDPGENEQGAASSSEDYSSYDYVLNLNSHKFHYPNCPSVGDMSPRNRMGFNGTREEAIEQGYAPCGNCRP